MGRYSTRLDNERRDILELVSGNAMEMTMLESRQFIYTSRSLSRSNVPMCFGVFVTQVLTEPSKRRPIASRIAMHANIRYSTKYMLSEPHLQGHRTCGMARHGNAFVSAGKIGSRIL